MEQWVFWPTAALSVISATVMLMSPNAVYSALALVGNFFTLAVFYVLLDAHFLAASQVIVYAGAIMVLFLFVIMLLGVDREEVLDEPLKFHRGLVTLLLILLGGGMVLTLRTSLEGMQFAGLQDANAGGNVEQLGRLLFNRYLFPFEVTSLLLIVAAVGAMVVGKRRSAMRPVDPEEEDA